MVLMNINKFVIFALPLIVHDVDLSSIWQLQESADLLRTQDSEWRHIAAQLCNKREIDPCDFN